jgi:hypothetical protein
MVGEVSGWRSYDALIWPVQCPLTSSPFARARKSPKKPLRRAPPWPSCAGPTRREPSIRGLHYALPGSTTTRATSKTRLGPRTPAAGAPFCPTRRKAAQRQTHGAGPGWATAGGAAPERGYGGGAGGMRFKGVGGVSDRQSAAAQWRPPARGLVSAGRRAKPGRSWRVPWRPAESPRQHPPDAG